MRFPPIEEVEQKLKTGEWQIHRFKRGFIVTEIKQYPEDRILLVWILSGERFNEWKQEAFERLKAFGKQYGCNAIEAMCRLGLSKKLKPLGFRTTRAELRAEI